MLRILGVPIPSQCKLVVLGEGGSNKGLLSFLMLFEKQMSIWCHFVMRILGYLSHRSFLWTHFRSSYPVAHGGGFLLPESELWYFWSHRWSCLMLLTAGKKKNCSLFYLFLMLLIWQWTEGFSSHFWLSSVCDSTWNHQANFDYCLLWSGWVMY